MARYQLVTGCDSINLCDVAEPIIPKIILNSIKNGSSVTDDLIKGLQILQVKNPGLNGYRRACQRDNYPEKIGWKQTIRRVMNQQELNILSDYEARRMIEAKTGIKATTEGLRLERAEIVPMHQTHVRRVSEFYGTSAAGKRIERDYWEYGWVDAILWLKHYVYTKYQQPLRYLEGIYYDSDVNAAQGEWTHTREWNGPSDTGPQKETKKTIWTDKEPARSAWRLPMWVSWERNNRGYATNSSLKSIGQQTFTGRLWNGSAFTLLSSEIQPSVVMDPAVGKPATKDSWYQIAFIYISYYLPGEYLPRYITISYNDPLMAPYRDQLPSIYKSMCGDDANIMNAKEEDITKQSYPPIPLRHNNKSIKDSDPTLYKQLQKYTKRAFGKDLIEPCLKSLEESPSIAEIDDAVLTMGIPLDATSRAGSAYLAKFFTMMGKNSRQTRIEGRTNANSVIYKYRMNIDGNLESFYMPLTARLKEQFKGKALVVSGSLPTLGYQVITISGHQHINRLTTPSYFNFWWEDHRRNKNQYVNPPEFMDKVTSLFTRAFTSNYQISLPPALTVLNGYDPIRGKLFNDLVDKYGLGKSVNISPVYSYLDKPPLEGKHTVYSNITTKAGRSNVAASVAGRGEYIFYPQGGKMMRFIEPSLIPACSEELPTAAPRVEAHWDGWHYVRRQEDR